MNIPNMISLFRIFLIPVFIYFFVTGSGDNRVVIPVIIFIISGISDVLDGYIARKANMQTKLGAVLDPLADKLMLVTALACFAYYNYIPDWIVFVVAAKELFMIAGSAVAWYRGIVTHANVWGKMATFLFHISIVSFLFSDMLALTFLFISIAVSFVALVKYIQITLAKKQKLDSQPSTKQ